MLLAADLHVHSRFSRATSGALTLPALHRTAITKGVTLVGTGDFTHPQWRAEIAEQLEPAEPGLMRLKPELRAAVERDLPPACRGDVRFVLQVEISSIYAKQGRTRKSHNLVFVPTLEAAQALVTRLERIGNLAADGRPILGLDARDLLEITLETHPEAFLVPAHIWTPWFSMLGSKSGFDSVDECFGDLSHHIFAAETGLSSDPPMNWRISGLDRLTLISNSDAHSPEKLGREANLLDIDLAYPALLEALRTRSGFCGTIEFFPEEGKYHLDGHRACGVCLAPEETARLEGRCPTCGGRLTVGVLSRVAELADRPDGHRPEGARDYQRLVPLAEVVAETLGVGPKSQRVLNLLGRLRAAIGPELVVLRSVPLEDLRRIGGGLLEEAVRRVRAAELTVEPGYDGEYGTVRLFDRDERERWSGQMVLGGGLERGSSEGAVQLSLSIMEPVEPIEERIPCETRPSLDVASSAELHEGPPPHGEHVLAGLDPHQREAAVCVPGPVLVVAGPGTGKTRTLVARVLHQVRALRVDPSQVLAITFTRQAALELEQRLEAALPLPRPHVTTFHGFGRWLLEQIRRAPPRVANDEQRLELLGLAAAGLTRAIKGLGERISLAKQSSDPSAVLNGSSADRRAFERYEMELRSRGLVDLDDLVLQAVQELRLAEPGREAASRFSCVVVDEYQDVSDIQAELVKLISPSGQTLCAIGDPDQSIYGFRGARPGHFARFVEDFPGTRQVELHRTYRLTRPVLSVATAILGGRRPLEARVDGPPVELVACPSARSEAEQIVVRIENLLGGTSSFALNSGRVRGEGEDGLGFGDMAILTRTKSQHVDLVTALGESGIPCRVIAEDEPHDPRAQKVAIMTMHAAKGREFRVVFVAGVENGLVPLAQPGLTIDPEEERRLLYVAVTRAQQICVLSYAEQRTSAGRTSGGPSRFLDRLPTSSISRSKANLPRTKRARQLDLFG